MTERQGRIYYSRIDWEKLTPFLLERMKRTIEAIKSQDPDQEAIDKLEETRQIQDLLGTDDNEDDWEDPEDQVINFFAGFALSVSEIDEQSLHIQINATAILEPTRSSVRKLSDLVSTICAECGLENKVSHPNYLGVNPDFLSDIAIQLQIPEATIKESFYK